MPAEIDSLGIDVLLPRQVFGSRQYVVDLAEETFLFLPLSLMSRVAQDPGGLLARCLSCFPFATPCLTVIRLALPPGVPRWELALGVLLTLVTMVFCVHAAGRVFRVGILLQGKGATLTEIVRSIYRGGPLNAVTPPGQSQSP